MRPQRIAVFTGPGASNSWVWLADFFERNGFHRTSFYSGLDGIIDSVQKDIIVVPGGDTLRIAQLFGKDGLELLKNSLSSGTGYVGICAGAYLPLRSSIPPLSSFNLTDIRIANLASSIPDDLVDPIRYAIPYGCSLVYHPVRGAVSFTGDADLKAPLYGGPFMLPQNGSRVRLLFDSLSEDSEPLIDRKRCEEEISGKAGCIECAYKKGRILLISPHLEHPEYPEANDFLTRLISDFPLHSYSEEDDSQCKSPVEIPHLRGMVADLMTRSNALALRSWKVGIKYWESEKILFFLDAIRSRLKKLGKSELRFPESVQQHLDCAMKRMVSVSNGKDAPEVVDDLVQHLSSATSIFLNHYFAHLRTEGP